MLFRCLLRPFIYMGYLHLCGCAASIVAAGQGNGLALGLVG